MSCACVVYRINIDKVMESLVDWDKQGKWNSKKSPAAIYNEIWRICMNDDAACDVVYLYIKHFVKFDESALYYTMTSMINYLVMLHQT